MRSDCRQCRHCTPSPCRSCMKPSVKRYSVRSRLAFFWLFAPQWGQMNSMTSNCGSRSSAAQPVRRTPTTSGIRLSIGFNLLESTSKRVRCAARLSRCASEGGVLRGTCRAPRCPMQQRTRAPHIPASAVPASCRQPQEAGAAKLPRGSRANLRRCVMRFERTSVAEEGLVSLRNCFLEGSAEEEKSARKVRRRAILTSIIVQILVLAALVLYPMLGRGERLPLTVVTPTVPYSYSGGHPSQPKGPRHPTPRQQTYGISAPHYIPPTIVTTDPARPTTGGDEQIGTGIPGLPDGDRIIGAPNAPGPESGPVKPQPEVKTHERKR